MGKPTILRRRDALARKRFDEGSDDAPSRLASIDLSLRIIADTLARIEKLLTPAGVAGGSERRARR